MGGASSTSGRALSRLAPWLAPAGAFLVYLLTMAPELTWRNSGADGGDLVTAAWAAGVPHPTGYPVWTMLAHLFVQLPLGTVAWRVNLFSAVAGAGAVLVSFRVVLRTCRDHPAARATAAAAAAALLFAFSRLLWSQSVIAEVYALHAFLVALVIWLVLRWRDGDGPLPLAALAFGIGLGNHVTLAFAAFPIALLLVSGRDRLSRRTVLASAGALLSGLLVYAWLPLRAAADPVVNWGAADTREGFLWLVTGEGYRRFVFGLPPGLLATKLGQLAREAWLQFPVPAWPLAAVGLVSLLRSRPWIAAGALLHSAVLLAYATGYSTTDSHVYLLPAWFWTAVLLGRGAVAVLGFAAKRTTAFGRRATLASAGACLFVLPLLSLWEFGEGVDVSADRQAREWVDETLGAVPPDALLFARADAHTFTLWYYRYVKRMRPDVTVVNPSLLGFAWYRRSLAVHHPELIRTASMRVMILRYRGLRPVYLVEEPEEMKGVDVEPAGRMWRVVPP